MSGYAPGMVNPCMPYRPMPPYFGMEGFYLERINAAIRDVPYSQKQGKYIAVERDSATGHILSHSKVGDLAMVRRYAASQYAVNRDQDRTGYDSVITGISLSTYAIFPLAPGRACECRNCQPKGGQG